MVEAHDEQPTTPRLASLRKPLESLSCFRSASHVLPSHVLPAASFCLSEMVAHSLQASDVTQNGLPGDIRTSCGLSLRSRESGNIPANRRRLRAQNLLCMRNLGKI